MSTTVRAATGKFPIPGIATYTITPDGGSAYTIIVQSVRGSNDGPKPEVTDEDGNRVGDVWFNVGNDKTCDITVTPVGTDVTAASAANVFIPRGTRVAIAYSSGTNKHPWLVAKWDVLNHRPAGDNAGLASWELSLQISSDQS